MKLSESANECITAFLNNMTSDLEIIGGQIYQSEVNLEELIKSIDQLTERRNSFVNMLKYLEANEEIIR